MGSALRAVERFLPLIVSAAILAGAGILSGCKSIDDDRIPLMPVNIDLSNQGIWDAYGVNAFGQYNIFILEDRLPPGFAYVYNSATGYGGVLLICGQSPFTGEVAPLAYDLSCPVERLPDVRVYIDPDSGDAVCPVCESHYNVIEGGGNAISGIAWDQGYGLTHYECYPTTLGGYIVTN